jgi:hypothetical protein
MTVRQGVTSKWIFYAAVKMQVHQKQAQQLKKVR